MWLGNMDPCHTKVFSCMILGKLLKLSHFFSCKNRVIFYSKREFWGIMYVEDPSVCNGKYYLALYIHLFLESFEVSLSIQNINFMRAKATSICFTHMYPCSYGSA